MTDLLERPTERTQSRGPANSLGFTGSRNGMTPQQAREMVKFVHDFRPLEVHHGVCEGSDLQFHGAIRAFVLNCIIHGHPSSFHVSAPVKCDVTHDPKHPLRRNEDIVRLSGCLLATPDGPERLRSGTWATIRCAGRSNVPITIIWPDGHITGFRDMYV